MRAFLDPTGSGVSLREKFVDDWQKRIANGVAKLARGRAWPFRLSTHVGFWVPREDQKKGAEFRFGATKGFMEPRQSHALQSNDGGTKKTPWRTRSLSYCWSLSGSVRFGAVLGVGVCSCVSIDSSTVHRAVGGWSALGSVERRRSREKK